MDVIVTGIVMPHVRGVERGRALDVTWIDDRLR
jgi:hypothetical protein